MEAKIKNLAVLKEAELSLGDITLICGKNNTGKTYITHTLYGFFEYLRNEASLEIEKSQADRLYSKGSVLLPFQKYLDSIQVYLDKAAKDYSLLLPKIFAGNKNNFKDASLSYRVQVNEIKFFDHEEQELPVVGLEPFKLKFLQQEEFLQVTFIPTDQLPPQSVVTELVKRIVAEFVFNALIPRPFLASAERTGVSIFQKELDFTRNRLFEILRETSQEQYHFIRKFSVDYPLAVRQNIDFIRSLPNSRHKESYILKEYPYILEKFKDLIGGEYRVSDIGDLSYCPSAMKDIHLSLVESSSAVRSLLDVGFYLRHEAKLGDILMIDEPELNLHPENQRKLARLFVSLANIGIKIFITTHSDYIIKELNTLIMLNRADPKGKLAKLAQKEGYSKTELLDYTKIKVYMTTEKEKDLYFKTLIEAHIDPQFGIEATTFDNTIDEMNRIQSEIVWIEEEEPISSPNLS